MHILYVNIQKVELCTQRLENPYRKVIILHLEMRVNVVEDVVPHAGGCDGGDGEEGIARHQTVGAVNRVGALDVKPVSRFNNTPFRVSGCARLQEQQFKWQYP